MWLVLCSEQDTAALWAALALERAGLRPLHVMTPGVLCYARTWEHTLDDSGSASAVVLNDGRRIASEAIRGIVNRLEFLPANVFSRAGILDRLYALQEMEAFLSAWLLGLSCPIANRPASGNLGGMWR